MSNLYAMTATVDELRRVFGSFDGDRVNPLPSASQHRSQALPDFRIRK